MLRLRRTMLLCALAAASFIPLCGANLPNQMTLVGIVEQVSGDNITIAALNAPKFKKTFQVSADTDIRQRQTKVDMSALAPGVAVVVHQSIINGSYKTIRVQIVSSGKTPTGK